MIVAIGARLLVGLGVALILACLAAVIIIPPLMKVVPDPHQKKKLNTGGVR